MLLCPGAMEKVRTFEIDVTRLKGHQPGDQIEVFNILNGYENIDINMF